jgi:hypothetical protein
MYSLLRERVHRRHSTNAVEVSFTPLGLLVLVFAREGSSMSQQIHHLAQGKSTVQTDATQHPQKYTFPMSPGSLGRTHLVPQAKPCRGDSDDRTHK